MNTSTARAANHVHLVGSIGLRTVEEVFSTCGRMLGRRLKRLPDGEVGGRRQWVGFQNPLLRSMPFLEGASAANGLFNAMRLRDGFNPAEIEFGELGYSREARASYEDFVAARKKGEIADDVRFMVALPTAYAVVQRFIVPESRDVVERAYTQAMKEEVERICAAIPHRDLAIQWDVCVEMLQWDGGDPVNWALPKGDGKAEITKRLVEAMSFVPDDVELGIHLCYGDYGATHMLHPKDATPMVEISNRIVAAAPRHVDWIHMPVDRRDDEEFYRPFANLHLPANTELYLGVVNLEDGLDGIRKRMDIASRYVSDFGISTECGIARIRTAALVKDIIALQAQATTEPVH